MTTKLELKQLLFDAYGGFADKRYKKIENDVPFIVDDRSESDFDAQKQLFLWFCAMFVLVEDGDRVRLTLIGGVPSSTDVAQWFADHRADMRFRDFKHYAMFEVTPENLDDLADLAERFAAITKGRYAVPAYKYVVPRVCRSLMRLHGLLAGAWRG